MPIVNSNSPIVSCPFCDRNCGHYDCEYCDGTGLLYYDEIEWYSKINTEEEE